MIGLGVDVVDLDRFAVVLRRRPSLAQRLYTDAERDYCERAVAPPARVERYAARFAVKEAVRKVIGVCEFREVEVVRSEAGEPGISLAGGAAGRAAARGVARWHVSITHSGLVAVAVVVAE